MKKFSLILLLTLILMFVFASCSTTFDGYSYSLDDARKNETSYYDEYDYIFKVEQNGYFVDFLVCGDRLHIIKFDIKEKSNTTLYKIKSKSTFLIDESLPLSESENEFSWIKSGNFPFQVEWLIVEKNIETPEGFEFVYDNVACVLLYRINENS